MTERQRLKLVLRSAEVRFVSTELGVGSTEVKPVSTELALGSMQVRLVPTELGRSEVGLGSMDTALESEKQERFFLVSKVLDLFYQADEEWLGHRSSA